MRARTHRRCRSPAIRLRVVDERRGGHLLHAPTAGKQKSSIGDTCYGAPLDRFDGQILRSRAATRESPRTVVPVVAEEVNEIVTSSHGNVVVGPTDALAVVQRACASARAAH